MKITQLKIELHRFNDSKIRKVFDKFRDLYLPVVFVKDENNYFAEAIECSGKYFYRVDGTTVVINYSEYQSVLLSPRLYYFSSALKLHYRIKKAQELGLGKDWPKNSPAPEDIFNLN